MKKIICLFLAVLLVLSLSACGGGTTETTTSGKQTASAYLDQDGACVVATVDLTGGWSVDYARGAVYVYDGENVDGKESIAMLVTLDKDVYDDHLKAAMADENHKETDTGVIFACSDYETGLVVSLDDTAYYLITTSDKDNAESIFSRFAVALE